MADQLRAAGHDAVHLVELGLLGATDHVVLSAAADRGRVLVSADTDFGALLRSSGRAAPSLVLLRAGTSSTEQLRLLLTALAENTDQLMLGAVVVVRGSGGVQMRVRRLPIG